MSLELLKLNLQKQKKLFIDLRNLYAKMKLPLSYYERARVQKAINSTIKLIKILNNSVPSLVEKIRLIQNLPSEEIKRITKPDIEEGEEYSFPMSYKINRYGDAVVSVSQGERKRYIKELGIQENFIQVIRDKSQTEEESYEDEYKSNNFFVTISNKIFFKTSGNLVDKGYFKDIGTHLKKGGFVFLLKSYISVVLFVTLLSILFSLIAAFFLFFFNVGGENIISPVNFSEDNIVSKIMVSFLILFSIPIITFFSALYYPYTEVSTLASKINAELPFVVIQMAAIASSDVEPTNIFKILSKNKDSPALARESKKIMNQVNLYGFDLTTALKNVAEASSSDKWAEVLNGMASTVISGGSLGNYLSKTSDSLLFHYRIEKEKSTKFAETFMGLYISIVIAAPMMIMLLLVIMSVADIDLPLSLFGSPVIGIAALMSSIVFIINIFFIFYLYNSQKGF
jgi:pilus assembly protein TadC